MSEFTDEIFRNIENELKIIWEAHKAVGIKGGKMCLYTMHEKEPWRAQQPGIRVWFGENEIVDAIYKLREYYNDGNLPNSPLLLNPVVHEISETGSYEPTGSGIMWTTAFTLGLETMSKEQVERIKKLGAFGGIFHRGENTQAGIKILAFSNEKLMPLENGATVPGNKELFDITGMECADYYPFYVLSDIEYLAKHGSFIHKGFTSILPKDFSAKAGIKGHAINTNTIKDAAYCWNSYDRHHSLYDKFGINPDDVEKNLRFFNLCGRDIKLFDATGEQRQDLDDKFEFLVEGWLPLASVTVVGATGGTGKSSAAHRLAVLSSIDWEEDEQPLWLGSPINKDKAKGLVIYFSGEDSAAIVNARAKMIDPEGRSNRMMLQRTDFGEKEDGQKNSIGDFLNELRKLPDVSLVVIDPARKYLEGDEEDSEVVSNFFEAIEEFAIEKKCAMLVVHHLIKNAHPRDTRDIYDMLRGSQVFIDRPRAVLGMMREGPHILVGLSKNNIPPNVGSIRGERVFVREPERLDLMWMPGDEGVRTFEVSDEELEQIRNEATKKAQKEKKQAKKKKG